VRLLFSDPFRSVCARVYACARRVLVLAIYELSSVITQFSILIFHLVAVAAAVGQSQRERKRERERKRRKCISGPTNRPPAALHKQQQKNAARSNGETTQQSTVAYLSVCGMSGRLLRCA